MPLIDLKNSKEAIVERWFDKACHTYPDEAARYLFKGKDKFANPVGSTYREAMLALVDGVLHGVEIGGLATHVEDIVKIRAVQEFTPSEAVAVFSLLKPVLEEEVLKLKGLDPHKIELLRQEIAVVVEKMVFVAFDSYVKCREKLWEIKYNEAMHRPFFAEVGMCPSYLLKRGIIKDGEPLSKLKD